MIPPWPKRNVPMPILAHMDVYYSNKSEDTTTGRRPSSPPAPLRLRSLSPRPPMDSPSGSETSTGAIAGDNGMTTYHGFPDSPVSYLNSIDDVLTSELSDEQVTSQIAHMVPILMDEKNLT